MKSILIRAMMRRAQFIRKAFLKAILLGEEARTRAAYKAKPDSEQEADDWSIAEEFRAADFLANNR